MQLVGIGLVALVPVLAVLGVFDAGGPAVLRIAFVYLALMAMFRVTGKRELSELSPFELVTLLMIPEILSPAVNRDDTSVAGAMVGVTTLIILVFATSLVTFRSKRAERVIEGEPTVLVRYGRFDADAMARERVTPAEVFAELHKCGLAELGDVRWAVLEADGKITVVPMQPQGTGARDDKRVA